MSRGKKAAGGAAKQVEALTHKQAKRKNIPTAELQSAAQRAEEIAPVQPVIYPRRSPLASGETRPRDKDLDPQIVWKGTRIRLTADQIKEAAAKGFIDIDDAQLVWRGKDQQDWSDLVVHAPPLYIQEKVHPKAIIDDLARRTKDKREADEGTFDLFHDFNGIDTEAKTEFYAHDQNWSNRFILGDSLQVMASLAEREGLRGQVQCIYFDPPYGINFGSNWQVSTRSRDVKDGKIEQISREPEQVRAFRDTWKDGIHSYLTYLRDRLTAMRDLLTPSGSIFVQIGDQNVHLLRALMDEIFGPDNIVSMISYRTSSPLGASGLPSVCDFILWYARSKGEMKYRQLYKTKELGEDTEYVWIKSPDGECRRMDGEEKSDSSRLDDGLEVFARGALYSSGYTPTCIYDFEFKGQTYSTEKKSWRTNKDGMSVLIKADRLIRIGQLPYFIQKHGDFPVQPFNNLWTDTRAALGKRYVVETSPTVIQRCLLMATDPGDLVLDPTCGSGTTATVAEQWGRRWITMDTSRVALALARARVMGAKYPYYLLADSRDGRLKEGTLTGVPRQHQWHRFEVVN